MLADYSVELGAGDAALELPWDSDDPALRYYDLKSHPEFLRKIPEAMAHPELGAFLARINAPDFPLATAKCDAWLTCEVSPEEEIFNAECKFACYIDLVFAESASRLSFEKHELLAGDACRLLRHAPQTAASIEFVLRRCYFHPAEGNKEESESGFYLTVYVAGFANSDEEARKQWTIALALVQNALVQVANRWAVI